MEVAIFLGSLFGFLFLGLPIALVLILCSIILMYTMGYADVMVIAQNIVQGSNSFPLMAIPFFTLAGEIMAKGGLSVRIVQFAKLIVGRIRGGLGYTAVVASIVFAGLSGSAVADAAALGGILIPLMIANGYKPARAAAFVASGSAIAPIIPPSIAFILIGSITDLSISKLFMIGIVPGLMIGIVLMVAWWFIVRKDGYYDTQTFTKEETIKIVKESIPALVMPIFIIGGIRTGIFTPTEAGAFAVVYALIICTFWYKEFDGSKVKEVFMNTAVTTSVVMLIVGGATAVGYFITLAQIQTKIAILLGPLIDNPILLLIVINLFLFVMGMIMDATPNNLIFAPILIPIVVKAGINPYFFAMLMCLNLTIGLTTPPVGTVLFINSKLGNVGMLEISKAVLPFLLAQLLLILAFILFPQLVLVPFELLT